MANTKGAEKRNRQIVVKTARNKSNMNAMRTSIKKLDTIVASNDVAEATKAISISQALIDKNAKLGIIHKNTAARKVAALAAKLKSIIKS